jgi:hypothetical protein
MILTTTRSTPDRESKLTPQASHRFFDALFAWSMPHWAQLSRALTLSDKKGAPQEVCADCAIFVSWSCSGLFWETFDRE